MFFHLGKPILAMVIVAVASGALIWLRPEAAHTDLAVWVFAESHARSYRGIPRSGLSGGSGPATQTNLAADSEPGAVWLIVLPQKDLLPGDEIDIGSVEQGVIRSIDRKGSTWTLELGGPLRLAHRRGEEVAVPSLVELYRRRTGITATVNVISSRALDVRLISLFNNRSPNVPDLVEVEIGSVGKFFRPPVDEVGFLPLNKYLERDGLMERMVQSRFAPWSKKGQIFGIPHDLHPCTITYRKDLFDEARIEIASAATWDDFQEKCLRFQRYWRDRGVEGRWAIELPTSASDYLVVMLLQRGLNVIDGENRISLNDAKVTDTIVRYAQMVAGPRRIAAPSTPGGDLFARDLAKGDLCALITPDWRAGFVVIRASELEGKVAMMPLPRFDPGDAPTSTWGGTMIGIPRALEEKGPEACERAWALLKFLYMTPEGLRARLRSSKILPPMRDQWLDPMYDLPDPYFSNQKVDKLFIDLAPRIPPRYVTALTPAASIYLANVLADAVEYVRGHESEPPDKLREGLRATCQKRLDDLARDLRERIEFGKFD